MKARLSLRARLALAALLWTLGLFTAAGIVLTHLIYTEPTAARTFHDLFRHGHVTWLIAGACLAAGFWLYTRGLRPVSALRIRLTAVHEGRERRVTGDYPAEIQPLVDDLNALLEHQEKMVARAQGKAGDLAHGLKTPLAVLANEIERAEAAGQRELAASIAEQIARMRRQIESHLAQARAASGATAGVRTEVRESADAIARTLGRLHADRGLAIAVTAPPGLLVRARREDLDEMLGNLVDNACKWGRHRVDITAAADGSHVVISVDDDGPGVPPAMRDVVLQRGMRADEAAPGSGLGLAIVRDLAEIHGGGIALDTSPAGGLRARLRLPAR
jgi:signal transduction histidine kinase